ncbi:lysophospholipid acyltransferase family protein [Mangrovibacterium marinum]|uniref:KDO2-lipid IV(A) lauroyltransferase n=1 Tax=Mangrovibacterium marinum TaxID=1639118 RepID=A0A2T5C1W5_9BACT|nr:lysophospholipid acyltransferase family protein [Mangrovibacterium marinum]PTN08598.1 KDO2-lipid IV(A) lauroyltransferase [Mangrovibacterium marinum]
MKTLGQKLTIVFLKALSYLPFPVLYLFSDIFYLLVFHLIGYRKKVVFKNLENAFPEKSPKEINEIARKYYHHFCDITVETLKMNRLPIEKMKKHIVFKNPELLNRYFHENRGIIVLCAHYNNWEWNSSVQHILDHSLLMVYSPMYSNPPMEKYMVAMREQYGAKGVPMNQAPRAGLSINKGPDYNLLWLAADQTPPSGAQYWTTFLNQETPFFSGPQKIALKTNSPVFYHHIHKVKRGQYLVEFVEINSNPGKDEEHAVLLDYVDIVEQIIRKQPEYWLWSHRRWKHQRKKEQQLIARNTKPRFEKQIDEMLNELNQLKSL